MAPRSIPYAVSPHRVFSNLLLLTGLAMLAATPHALADTINGETKLLIHLVPDNAVDRVSCFNHGVEKFDDVVTHGELSGDPGKPAGYLAYVLVAGFDEEYGVSGLQFGIAYDPNEGSGIDIDGWQDCALYEWHGEDWPQAGTGNLLTWNQDLDCQNKNPVVVGFFHLVVHSDDQLRLIKRPVDQKSVLAACGVSPANYREYSTEIKPNNMGITGFGKAKSYNPWDPEQRPEGMIKKFKTIDQDK